MGVHKSKKKFSYKPTNFIAIDIMRSKESLGLLVVSEGRESRVTSLTKRNGVCRLLSREFARSRGVGGVGYLRSYSLLY